MASRNDVIAGGAAVEIRALDYTAQVFGKVEANLYKMGAAATKIGAGMVAAAGTAAAGLAAFTIAAASSAAAVDDASKRTGVGAEALQELRYGAEQSGASFEGLIKAMRALNIAFSDGTGRDKLAGLGLSLEELGKMTPDQRFAAVAEAIKNLGDESQQTAAANEIFGKSGFELLPFLQEGAAGISKMRGEARGLGQVLSADGVSALAKFDDSVAKLTGSLRGLAGVLASQLAPYFGPIADGIISIVVATNDWLSNNSGVVAALLGSIGAFGATGVAIAGFGVALTVLASVISSFTVIAGAVTAAIGFFGAPFLLIAAAIAAVIAVIPLLVAGLAFLLTPLLSISSAGEQVGGVLGMLNGMFASFQAWAISTFGQTVGGMADAFSNGDLVGAAEIAFLSIQIAATHAWTAILTNTQKMLGAMTAGFAAFIPGVQEAFDAFSELNDATKKGLQIELDIATAKQARTRATKEATEAANAEYDAEQAAYMAAWGIGQQPIAPPAAVPAAVADAGAKAKSEDRFGTSGTSTSGAAAFMGGVTWFKPLEDLQNKANAILERIAGNTADGMGVAIT